MVFVISAGGSQGDLPFWRAEEGGFATDESIADLMMI